jgi:hypothetical protein
MSSEGRDARAIALEIYRIGWAELHREDQPKSERAQFFLEDLREALLDLKQATIAEDSAGMWQALAEVTLLIGDLRRESRGES